MSISRDREAPEARQKRLAEALRQNLYRRKARQRSEVGEDTSETLDGVAEQNC